MDYSLEALIRTVGYAGLFAIVFAETGLLIGFFLPGDSLLITAGLLAQRGHLDVVTLLVLLTIAAIAGDATGFFIGRQAGPRLFVRDDARFFRREYLERARAFFDRHGGKAIILARFMAVLRTFVPTVAGAAGLDYRRFTLFNVVGGVLWTVSMIGMGYTVGNAIPGLDLVIIAIVVALSLVPVGLHLWQDRRGR